MPRKICRALKNKNMTYLELAFPAVGFTDQKLFFLMWQNSFLMPPVSHMKEEKKKIKKKTPKQSYFAFAKNLTDFFHLLPQMEKTNLEKCSRQTFTSSGNISLASSPA